MNWILVLLGTSALAGLSGYVVHHWRLVPIMFALGVIVIVVDISTRDLTSGGHDDRVLVAIAEAIFLLLLLAAAAVGIAISQSRPRHLASRLRRHRS